MKIKSVTINKFRSIENGTFRIDNIVAVVGQNNSGKTAVLRALNSFFNEELELAKFMNDEHLYSPKRAKPRIIITFNKVTTTSSSFSSYLTGDELTIKQEFNTQKRKIEYFVQKSGTFEPAPDTLIKYLKTQIQFVYIPTYRSNGVGSANENVILAELLKTYFANHTSKRDNLTPRVKQVFDVFQNNVLQKISSGIEGRYMSNRGFKFSINTSKNLNYELFLNDLEIQIIENTMKFKLSECGSGIQSLVAIAVYRYLSELKHSNIVIGLEEPEINLHPQAQKTLLATLLKEVNKNVQIVFTTHSTVLLDQIDHTKVLLVRKVDDKVRSFKSTISQLSENFWTENSIHEAKYKKFHHFRNSEFFFSNHVIITESTTDSEIFQYLAERKRIDLDLKGISFLNLDGVKSLKYAYHLVRELDIPYTIIVDKDFFFNYSNGKKEDSRNTYGFYKYEKYLKGDKMISNLIKSETERKQIEKNLFANHSKALNTLEKYNIISMNYNLEMDILSSAKSQNYAYSHFNIDASNRNTYYLLKNYNDSIKDANFMLEALSKLTSVNMPHSLSRIQKRLTEIAKLIS